MRLSLRLIAFALIPCFFAHRAVVADDQLPPQSTRITAEALGLPKTNQRKSEPFVVRIYRTDDDGNILPKQPDDYPVTVTKEYDLKDNEKPRIHEGVDLQSRPSQGEPPKPLQFNAGVHGVVVRAGGGNYGMIAVQVWDGSVLEFLHSSKSLVKVGDVVAPDTPLGITGKTGAGFIHLHVQAKNTSHKPISPDLVFRVGQHPLQSSANPEKDWGDFDPEESNAFELRVQGKKVIVPQFPKTKWIVDVIGMGGEVDLTLGEFWSYSDALVCSLAWSKSHPDDLRLTREREVPAAGK
jgi:murein DD-endopeptidase MepM/ murein hydrolase activator NlpD